MTQVVNRLDRRAFLAVALGGGAALALDHGALAAVPIEASAVRTSPAAVKIDWQGAQGPAAVFVAPEPYAPRRGLRRVAAAAQGAVDVDAPSSPRPYFLVRTRAGETWTAERLLPLQGGRNFRDLGGYRGAGGKQVRWGRIFRSGVMSGLTDADLAYLGKLGVNTVCDLRSAQERQADPSAFLRSPSAKVVAFDYELASSLDGLTRAKTRDDAIDAFASAYVAFLDTLTPQYTDMFTRLARGEAPLALNCSAGKDRTGVGSALILSVLGVSRETVVADYALTQVYTPPSTYAQAMNSSAPTPGLTSDQARALRGLPPDVLQVIMGSDPEVMRRALALIDRRYGGPEALVKTKFGLTDAGAARMRRLYLV